MSSCPVKAFQSHVKLCERYGAEALLLSGQAFLYFKARSRKKKRLSSK